MIKPLKYEMIRNNGIYQDTYTYTNAYYNNKIYNLPIILRKVNNSPLLFIPISYLSTLGIDFNTENNILYFNSTREGTDKHSNHSNENEDLKNEIKALKEINYQLKQEINRLKSFPKDIPYKTEYDHIFSDNSEFFIYYGKKNFTSAIEESNPLTQFVSMTQSDGLRVTWVYYPAANQIYLYISFINQRLGLNNFEDDKIRNMIGNVYIDLQNDFNAITKDKTIRLEISFIFLENIEGYEAQRSIYINNDNVNQFIEKNTSK